MAWDDEEDDTIYEVVINHDGKVLSDRILRRSGIRILDGSVQDALDRVRARGLPPFPQGAKDLQRTFRINFNLRTRQLLG